MVVSQRRFCTQLNSTRCPSTFRPSRRMYSPLKDFSIVEPCGRPRQKKICSKKIEAARIWFFSFATDLSPLTNDLNELFLLFSPLQPVNFLVNFFFRGFPAKLDEILRAYYSFPHTESLSVFETLAKNLMITLFPPVSKTRIRDNVIKLSYFWWGLDFWSIFSHF